MQSDDRASVTTSYCQIWLSQIGISGRSKSMCSVFLVDVALPSDIMLLYDYGHNWIIDRYKEYYWKFQKYILAFYEYMLTIGPNFDNIIISGQYNNFWSTGPTKAVMDGK